MKVLGISGSCRSDDVSGCSLLVKTVLEATDCEYELVSLRGKKIGGCVACLGCVEDQVCKVKDDMEALREKFVEADAFVIGSPNYYSGLNATTHAVLERLFQFRHQEGDTLWGKLAVAVGVGGVSGNIVTDQIAQFMAYNFVDTVAKVAGQGAASCFSCGYGETCKVGVPYMLYGEGVKITDDMIPNVSKQQQVMQAAVDAGRMLGEKLRGGHDRAQVTARVQKMMMEKFEGSA